MLFLSHSATCKPPKPRVRPRKVTYTPPFLLYTQLTGEASTSTRRALTASVSHAGSSVEPQSLSCAVDVTPGDFGGGPLGSAVLIEQIKRAGAAKEVRKMA